MNVLYELLEVNLSGILLRHKMSTKIANVLQNSVKKIVNATKICVI